MPNPITPDDYSPLLNIVTWFLLSVTALSVFARLATKWTVNKLAWDDYTIFIALLCASGNVAALSTAASHGLGRRFDTLNAEDIVVLQQALYAAEMLFILTMVLSAISVLTLLYNLTPSDQFRNATLGFGALISVWMLSAIFIIAFQCKLPTPWQFVGNSCINRLAFWHYIAATNIIIQVALIVFPFIMLWKLQSSLQKKLAIWGCFASRIVVIPACALQLFYTEKYKYSPDPTINYEPTLCMEFALHLSIITASVVLLKPLYLGMETGMIRSDDVDLQGATYAYGTKRSRAGSVGSRKHTARRAAFISSEELDYLRSGGREKHTTKIEAKMAGIKEMDAESFTSQTRIIKQTTTWAVDTEAANGHVSSDSEVQMESQSTSS